MPGEKSLDIAPEVCITSTEPFYYHVELPTDLKKVILIGISDLHYGCQLTSVKHFDRTIDYIENTPNVYAVCTGDLVESALKTSLGDIYKQVGTPQDQRNFIIEKLKRIHHKILGMCTGNHENRIYKDVGIDITHDIAKALRVPYRAEAIALKISFGDGNKRTEGKPYVYYIYATHGYGGARTRGAKTAKLERTSTFIDADVYMMSHDHVVNVAPDVYLKPDHRTFIDKETGFKYGKYTAKRKILVKTNAYLKWGGYAEMKGFGPADLETPEIWLSGEGGKPKVRVLV